ncbi:hypothetical protein [Rhodohalobacter mucosus]|uniref:Uncharacterized protein n=1 Tax=Rhodohalobacter mucosus TaxID=2079485 RepID=A0A316TL44_9BACT|nr:hypothetical protein [Rhodohalobacter mucosus]PWN05090.1 hypothetical protein DDZ15_16165 [Rhodohalobacter mucosus]
MIIHVSHYQSGGRHRRAGNLFPGVKASGYPEVSGLRTTRSRATGYRLQATGYRLQATGYRLQATGYKGNVVVIFTSRSLRPRPHPH